MPAPKKAVNPAASVTSAVKRGKGVPDRTMTGRSADWITFLIFFTPWFTTGSPLSMDLPVLRLASMPFW
jgi:hypothetical protein